MFSVIIKIILALGITLKDFKHLQQFLDYTLRTTIVQNSYKKQPHKRGLIIRRPVKMYKNTHNCKGIQFGDYIKVTE